jgi:hypothetical protein
MSPAVPKLVRADLNGNCHDNQRAIQYEKSSLGHWMPPPVAEVQRMSPRQIDEPSRQIMQQVEQQIEQHERQRGHQ